MPNLNSREYIETAKLINSVGLSKLKLYCTTKKYPVRDFDRDIAILRQTIKYGPTSAVTKFGISRQCAHQIMQKYKQFALECAKMEESP